jgi:hypothetical protein
VETKPNTGAPADASKPDEQLTGPPVARVREEDLEPHEGLRYIAKLFKALAVLLIFMFVAELVIGFRHDGGAALGTLLVEGTRTLVYAGFLWGAGDLALMFIESNHDLRATRILLGRLNGKIDRMAGIEPSASDAQVATPRIDRGGPRSSRS